MDHELSVLKEEVAALKQEVEQLKAQVRSHRDLLKGHGALRCDERAIGNERLPVGIPKPQSRTEAITKRGG